MEQIKTVDITINSVINDLNTGLTWLEKDNIGYGSIQDKYDATETQILVIMKHPKLVGIEPVRVFINLIDDTEDNTDKTQHLDSRSEHRNMEASQVLETI